MNRYAPVFSLALAAPFLAEFLFGATPITRLGGFPFLALLYGGGAILVRELARRRGVGWWRIMVLAVAYALIEEGLVVQSMFNPDLFQAGAVGGRGLGVNWTWTEWTVGYHVLWSMLIPIFLTETLFPRHRSEPWLNRTGVVIVGIIYALGVFIIDMAFRHTVAPNFHAPISHLVATGTAVLVLVLIALAAPKQKVEPGTPPSKRTPPSVFVLGVVGLVVAAGWFGLLVLPASLKIGARILLPMALAVLVAAAAGLLVRTWSTAEAWTDRHGLAFLSGALLVSMSFGFFIVTAGNRVDQTGQGVACIITLIFLGIFAHRLGQRRKIVPATSASAARL